MYNAKLQLPVETQVLEAGRKKARKLGFSSLNDVMRLMLGQFVNGVIQIRVVSNGVLEYKKELDRRCAELEEDIRSGKAKGYDDVNELMKDLNRAELENE